MWIYVIFCVLRSVSGLKSFGMNKPHFLFHLGDRKPVQTNVGWGYWADQYPLRMKYANSQDGLYVDMTVSDGQTIFEQKVQDRRMQINSIIKYQLIQNGWQAKIQMQNTGTNQTTWFTYFSVQNNDYKLVDHKKYTSFVYFIPKTQNIKKMNKLSIDMLSSIFPNQTLTIQNNVYNSESGQMINKGDDIKIFGITANISQTYTIHNIAQTFKHLIRVEKGNEKTEDKEYDMPLKDNKVLDWQKSKIELIKKNEWTEKSYVVLFLYGTVSRGQKCKIYLTNSTNKGSFNNAEFDAKRTKLEELYTQNVPEDKKKFVIHTISNLYAGLTFYFGRLLTQNSLTDHRQDYSYSFTPSRLIFPRSFLWDDGFHQSVAINYNPNLVIDILTNWMNKVDIFGWIGREQIRGSSISQMMPEERFVFQDWFEMNPPTLMLSIISLIKLSQTNPTISSALQVLLSNNYHKLEQWYRYFKNTQSHQGLEYSETTNNTERFYRWHCKDECSKGNFMGSGLDDYPRRNNQEQIAKQHTDLTSWLYFFSDSLHHVASYLEKTQKIRLDKENNDQSRYKLRNKYTKRASFYKNQCNQYIRRAFYSLYDKKDNLFKDVVASADFLIKRYVQNIGYINLFPFLTGMLAQVNFQNNNEFSKLQEERVKSIKKCLKIMSDEQILLSEDGLRSLSFTDPLYGTQQNYWRGAVWLPINYMVLRACKKYYWNDPQVGTQVQQFYDKLKVRLIGSVFNTYEKTGYLFQNYYQGKGHRGYPFYGWTSTIVNIITQKY